MHGVRWPDELGRRASSTFSLICRRLAQRGVRYSATNGRMRGSTSPYRIAVWPRIVAADQKAGSAQFIVFGASPFATVSGVPTMPSSFERSWPRPGVSTDMYRVPSASCSGLQWSRCRADVLGASAQEHRREWRHPGEEWPWPGPRLRSWPRMGRVERLNSGCDPTAPPPRRTRSAKRAVSFSGSFSMKTSTCGASA